MSGIREIAGFDGLVETDEAIDLFSAEEYGAVGGDGLGTHLLPWILADVPSHCRTVLEVGCWNGALAAEFAQRGYRVVGIDSNRDAIAVARRRFSHLGNLDFVWGDFDERGVVRALAEDFGPFDLILSTFSLHHMRIPSARQFMMDLLSEGGRAIVYDNYRSRQGGVLSYYLEQVSNLATDLLQGRFGKIAFMKFWWWRLRFLFSRQGLDHVRFDINQGMPPKLVKAPGVIRWGAGVVKMEVR